MTECERNYVDLLTRWLQTKRDYPGMEGDEPRLSMVWFVSDVKVQPDTLREQTIREFQRTA